MRKTYLFLAACFLLLLQSAFAQPGYYYQASNNGSNLSTFNSSFHVRSQFLYYASDLNTTFTGGNITAVYVMPSNAATNATYTDFIVRLGTTSSPELSAGAWSNTGLDTVFFAATHTFPNVQAGVWLKIELQQPFYWNGTDNLIFDVEQTSYTNGFATTFNNPGGTIPARMKYGPATGSTYLNNFPPIFFGLDVCAVANLDLGNDTTICEGGSLVLDAQNPGSSYLWNDNSGNQTLTVDAAGRYYVTVSNEGCTVSDTINIAVTPLPSASAINYSNDGGGSYTFQVVNAQNATSYSWNFGDGNTSTGTGPSHTYASRGTYTITLIVSNECGSDTLTTTLTDNLGIGATATGQIAGLYPNPANNLLHIDFGQPVSVSDITVINMLGQELLRTDAPASAIDISSIPSGIYMLRVTTDEGIYTGRFEIAR
ncbi:MAG: hypothetical protein BGO09_14320 [Bacteroidetes bacterium 47-18]|nr:MAG: hypothetical protein BGO09_14320 [Bacteroidetes bacterium 47-18]